jgi:hypothetical protein
MVVTLLSACHMHDSPAGSGRLPEGPIQLHPENPHYFLFKGKPLVLISSAEHYGALINLDFDYERYLETLSEEGMNYTRIFAGTYFEIEGQSFSIQHNTLAPASDRLLTPWEKVKMGPGEQEKYDLSRWNEAYFERLKDIMGTASEQDIIVEITLFSSIYRDEHWNICPQNPANNINVSNDVTRFEAQTLNNGELLQYQINFVRKMVNELNGFDNFFFEIQNEPWSDHAVPVYNIVNKEDLNVGDWTNKADFADEASLAWQDKLASVIVEEEAKLANRHLIAQNYTNFRAPIPAVSEHISIINFHYAWPDAVTWNYQYERVIGFDESGFAGPGDQVYRRQAWQFMLSGGGLFNNLDYSFYAGHEDGLGKNSAPGGGSQALRSQLKILKEFLNGFDLPEMHPDKEVTKSSPGLIPYVLSDQNNAYALFLRAVGTTRTFIQLETGDGRFRIQKINTLTGAYSSPMLMTSREGMVEIDVEIPLGELAIKITRE